MQDMAVCFSINNQPAVLCVTQQGSVQSKILLAISETLFKLAHKGNLVLSAQYLPG